MELFAFNSFDTDTAVSVATNVITVPKDKCFVIANVTVNGTPGAAQTIDRLRATAFTHTGLGVNILDVFPTAAAAQQVAENWQGEVWVLGRGIDGTSLTITGTFNAGVNANSVGIGVTGFLIPRANLSVF